MPLTEDQREALRLELLARANERDRWISDRDRKLRAELDQARTQIRDCNAYSDLPDWERRKITPEIWAARKVVRKAYEGAPARHELDLMVEALASLAEEVEPIRDCKTRPPNRFERRRAASRRWKR